MTKAVQVDDGAAHALVLGLGCERGTAAEEVIALAEEALRTAGRDRRRLAFVVSLDTRAEEPAMSAAARHFAVPLRTFDATTLEAETPRLAHPSDVVFRHTGCHGVAEASALAAAGRDARLLVPKMKSAHATVAIAEVFQTDAESPSESDSASGDADHTAVRTA